MNIPRSTSKQAGSEGAALAELRGLCANDAEFEQVRLIWELTEAPASPPGRKRLWLKIKKYERWQQREHRRRFPTFAAAAALVVLTLAGVGLLKNRKPGLEPSVVLVPAGSVTTLELTSGVQARINAGSRLSFVRPSPKRVEVELEGEVFFEVAGEEGRVVVIRSDAGEVRNTGTRYNVQARGGELVVAVVEGEVVLRAAGEEVIVRAGEQSSAVVGEPPTEPIQVDPLDVRAWLDGMLVFRDQPLSEVVRRLERHYGVPFEVEPEIAGQRLTAIIRTKVSGDAARTICLAVGARCREVRGGWKISSATR